MKKIFLLTLLLVSTHSIFATPKISSFDNKTNQIAAKARNLKPKIIRLALSAFYQAIKLGVPTKKPIITIIDYSLPSTSKRLWVLDLVREKVLYTSMVAHGKYSGENYTKNFSNQIGSLKTSVGVFLTENTYFGRDGYSLRIQGLEKGFNDNAKIRTIVMHGAPYVSQKFAKTTGRIGRSWGCPAVEKQLAQPIINTIKNGTLVLSFYPDKKWLNQSRFVSQNL